jgi:hypothetical protein
MTMMTWRRTATLLVLSCSLLSPQARLAQAQADQVTDSGWPRFSGRGFGGGGFGGFHGGGFHSGSRR